MRERECSRPPQPVPCFSPSALRVREQEGRLRRVSSACRLRRERLAVARPTASPLLSRLRWCHRHPQIRACGCRRWFQRLPAPKKGVSLSTGAIAPGRTKNAGSPVLCGVSGERRRPDSNRGITDLQSVALGRLATAPESASGRDQRHVPLRPCHRKNRGPSMTENSAIPHEPCISRDRRTSESARRFIRSLRGSSAAPGWRVVAPTAPPRRTECYFWAEVMSSRRTV